MFTRTNENYTKLSLEAHKLGLNIPIEQKDEVLVAPRFSVIIPVGIFDEVYTESARLGVEIGRWFADCPPQ